MFNFDFNFPISTPAAAQTARASSGPGIPFADLPGWGRRVPFACCQPLETQRRSRLRETAADIARIFTFIAARVCYRTNMKNGNSKEDEHFPRIPRDGA